MIGLKHATRLYATIYDRSVVQNSSCRVDFAHQLRACVFGNKQTNMGKDGISIKPSICHPLTYNDFKGTRGVQAMDSNETSLLSYRQSSHPHLRSSYPLLTIQTTKKTMQETTHKAPNSNTQIHKSQ